MIVPGDLIIMGSLTGMVGSLQPVQDDPEHGQCVPHDPVQVESARAIRRRETKIFFIYNDNYSMSKIFQFITLDD